MATIDNITLRQVAYAIAQVYEFFESFLFDILTVNKIEKDGGYKGSNSFDQIRVQLKKELRGRNNSEVLRMIRDDSEIYRSHEVSNVASLNLVDWIEVFSLARHSITHSNLAVKSVEFARLQSHQQALFQKCFPCVTIENELMLAPTFETFIETIRTTNAHTILIFRGLSNSLGLESHPIFLRGPHPVT